MNLCRRFDKLKLSLNAFWIAYFRHSIVGGFVLYNFTLTKHAYGKTLHEMKIKEIGYRVHDALNYFNG